ncbi:MAG: hypothetical protein ACXVA9_03840 [Bdellovibrionales bacterium]
MLKVFLTAMVPLLVLMTACGTKYKKANAPSSPTVEQKLYGYWQLETKFEKASEVPRVPGVIKFELNRNNINSADYCMADRSANGGSIFSVVNGRIEFQVLKVDKNSNALPGVEMTKYNITRLTANELQLDGKYDYRRFVPAAGTDSTMILTDKISPFCAFEKK